MVEFLYAVTVKLLPDTVAVVGSWSVIVKVVFTYAVKVVFMYAVTVKFFPGAVVVIVFPSVVVVAWNWVTVEF